jgi:hypothetical protein
LSSRQVVKSSSRQVVKMSSRQVYSKVETKTFMKWTKGMSLQKHKKCKGGRSECAAGWKNWRL